MTGRDFFRRILMGYSALALVFTLICGIGIYISCYDGIVKSFSANKEAELGKIVQNTDLCFSTLKNITEYIAGDEAVASYAAGDESSEARVQNLLKRCSENLSQNGMNVYISRFSSSLDRVVGASRTVSVYSFLESCQIGGGAGESIRDYFRKDENAGKVFVRYCIRSAPRNMGCILTIDRKTINGENIYIICTLDADTINALLSGGSSAAFMDGQNLICNIGSNTFKTTDKINSVVKKDYSFATGHASVSADGILYKSAPSKIHQWQYILCAPADGLVKAAWELALAVFAVCCLCLAVLWALSRLVVRWVYSPMNDTVKFISKYNPESVYDENVFIRRSFTELNDKKEKSEAKLAQTADMAKRSFLKDLLFGSADMQTLDADIGELGFSDFSGPYRAVLLQFADYDVIAEAFPKENMDRIMREIEEFINDQLKAQVVYGALQTDEMSIAFISFGTDVRRLRETLADMAMMVQGSFDVEITGAIGTDCDKLRDIAESYKSSQSIMKNRVCVGSRNAIVTEEDVRAANTEGFYYPFDAERELIVNVIRARREEAHRIISEILSENLFGRRLSKDRLDAFVFAITATVNRIIDELGKTPEEIFGAGKIVFLDLKMCRETEELEKKIYEMFDAITDCIDAENREEEDNLADSLLEYIHSNYNKDISLTDIGGHFNLSQCYASTLFKEATGENFKDYLSRYRIKKAKEILEKDPNVKNSELAKMIGCNTVATLFRLFNKYEGMSPGQYIKNVRQQEE